MTKAGQSRRAEGSFARRKRWPTHPPEIGGSAAQAGGTGYPRPARPSAARPMNSEAPARREFEAGRVSPARPAERRHRDHQPRRRKGGRLRSTESAAPRGGVHSRAAISKAGTRQFAAPIAARQNDDSDLKKVDSGSNLAELAVTSGSPPAT